MLTKSIPGEISVSIIIPTYKNIDHLRKNIPAVIEAFNNKKNKIFEIIIVDDASPDNDGNLIKKEFKNIKVIRHSQMRGYLSAVNTGARSSKGKLIVLLSSDAHPSKNFLEPVFNDFHNNSVFSVSLNERGYSWEKCSFKDGFVIVKQAKRENKTHDTFFVSSACGVFRRDYWMQLGGVDEKILPPYHWGDVDLSYRAAKRGLINVWNPKALVAFGSQSNETNKLNKWSITRERNKLLFHWKNITSKNLFRKHLFGLLKRLLREPAYLLVLFSALKKLKLIFKARKKEFKESKISDEAIIAKFSN